MIEVSISNTAVIIGIAVTFIEELQSERKHYTYSARVIAMFAENTTQSV